MCQQFGISVIKAVTALANTLLLSTAVAILARTSIVLSQYSNYSYVLDSDIQSIPLLGVVISAIIISLVLFGFLGMILNAFGILCIYTTFLFIFGVTAAIVGIYILTEAKEMQSDASYFINRLDTVRNITQNPDAMLSINRMQEDLMCCGFQLGRYQYWNENQPLPPSCCKDPGTECYGADIWEDTCISKLEVFGVVTSSEEGTLMICMATQCLLVAGISYVLSIAVRQYYYY